MQTHGGDGDSYKKKNMNAFKNAKCSSTTAPLAEYIRCPVRKIGRNVVDIELVTPLHGQDLLAMPLVKAPVHRDVLLPTRIGRFGPLQVPVAHQATQLIRRLYGDEWATRMCNGKRVPDCVPHVALPS